MTNKPSLGRDFDRDKNLTYRPQDESGNFPYNPMMIIDTPLQDSVASMIFEQHRQIREHITALLHPRATNDEKQKALFEIIGLWVPHAQAEENALYDEILFSQEEQRQVDEAYEEHAIAQIMIDELETLNFRLMWTPLIEQKAKALAEVIKRHLNTEEESYLRLIQDLVPHDDLKQLGREYARQYKAAASHYKASLKPSRILS